METEWPTERIIIGFCCNTTVCGNNAVDNHMASVCAHSVINKVYFENSSDFTG